MTYSQKEEIVQIASLKAMAIAETETLNVMGKMLKALAAKFLAYRYARSTAENI